MYRIACVQYLRSQRVRCGVIRTAGEGWDQHEAGFLLRIVIIQTGVGVGFQQY